MKTQIIITKNGETFSCEMKKVTAMDLMKGLHVYISSIAKELNTSTSEIIEFLPELFDEILKDHQWEK